jgi:hypothetical protein
VVVVFGVRLVRRRRQASCPARQGGVATPSCSWFRHGLEALAGYVFVGLLVLGTPDVVDASIWPVSFCWR